MGHDAAGWLRLLGEIAERADRLALAAFRSKDLRVEAKADLTPVSAADLDIEEAARELVSRRCPGLGVCGEEHGEVAGSSGARLWIDPIDATANFVRGVPVFATLLAIEEAGEILAGLVSAPALGERWSAARGHGAFAGSRRLRVSGVGSLAEATLFHGSLAGGEAVELTRRLSELASRTARQRGFGDFWQHVLVADGAGEISFDPVLRSWDAAPLIVIVEEAGGRATSTSGERTPHAGSLVCTNGRLHDAVLALLTG